MRPETKPGPRKILAEAMIAAQMLLTDRERHEPEGWALERARELVPMLDQLGASLKLGEYSAITLRSEQLIPAGAVATVEAVPQRPCKLYSLAVPGDLAQFFSINCLQIGQRSLLLSADPVAAEAFSPRICELEGDGCEVSILGLDPNRPLDGMLCSNDLPIPLGMYLRAEVTNRSLHSRIFELTAYVEILEG